MKTKITLIMYPLIVLFALAGFIFHPQDLEMSPQFRISMVVILAVSTLLFVLDNKPKNH